MMSTVILYSHFFLLLTMFAADRVVSVNQRYQIDPASELRLEGATNVNQFSCICQESFPPDTYELLPEDAPSLLKFRNTDLDIPIRKLDCKHKGINRDLQKALKAESFPFINIEILSLRLPDNFQHAASGKWIDIPVQTQITVAGECRPLHLLVQVNALDRHRYRLRSTTTILMSAFGIDPPQPMLGLIKVKDQIRIHFDLILDITTSK